MSTMRSWPRWPRSASCAPRSSWNRAPTRTRQSEPEPAPSRGVDHQDHRRGVHLLPDQTRHTDAAKFDAALQSHHDALIAEWKHDHDNGDHDNGERANGEHDDGR